MPGGTLRLGLHDLEQGVDAFTRADPEIISLDTRERESFSVEVVRSP